METIHTIDRERQQELLGHAAILLRLNHIEPAGRRPSDIIQQAISASVLEIDEPTRLQIGLA